MMHETEIKHEFPDYEHRCSVCLSIGRKLSCLGPLIKVFMNITGDIAYRYQTTFNELKLCWECTAFLQRAKTFQQHVHKANEILQLGQNYLLNSQSSLTTVILNDCHPQTVYINDNNINIQSDQTISDNIDDDIKCDDDFPGDVIEPENVVKENVNTEKKKPKNNRWAIKRALQNKKPKFKIITEYSENCIKTQQINDEELHLLLKSERDSKYFKSKRFTCEYCVLTFSSKDLLVKHDKKMHDKSALFSCDICKSSFSSKKVLSQHISKHYVKFSCTLCEFASLNKSLMRSHYERRHRKVFQCLKCELKFGSRREFFKHFKEWHEKFVCDHCGISFKMRYCIKDHIRKQHSPFECKPCNKRWSRYNGLWLHKKSTHLASSGAYCVECDRHYRDVCRYRWHLANTHAKHCTLPVPCPGCDKIFSKKIYMKDHYNLVHLKYYKYRCEQCDKNFIRNADLVKHNRRIHEGILPPRNKICYVCGKGFTTNKILTNHLRTHTGEKPFACTICNARFAQSAALSAHSKAIHHTRDKQA